MAPAKNVKKFKCSCCGKEYGTQERNFKASMSKKYEGNNFRITTCNDCLDKEYNEFVKIYDGEHEKAVKAMCSRYDWYYDKIVAKRIPNLGAGNPTIGHYLRQMNLGQYKTKTYVDYVKGERIIHGANDLDETDGLSEEDKEIIEEAQRIFGVVKSKKDAKILKYYYDDWMTKTGASSITQENVIKNICWNLLDIQKARELGKDTKDLEKTLRENIVFGGWKPDNKDEDLSQETFGTWIKKLEMNKPVEDTSDKSYLAELIDVYFYGHAAKSNGIKNMYSEKYDEHIKKFSVSRDNKTNKKKNDALKKIFGEVEVED